MLIYKKKKPKSPFQYKFQINSTVPNNSGRN